jgi:lysophospholipase L1-like esterase
MTIVELRIPPKNAHRILDRSVIDHDVPSITYRTNARGYIEPALRFGKPDYTIVYLGGSTTECLFVQENLRFPALTSFLLEKQGLRVNALNFGVSGNDSHHSLNNLLNYAVNDKPDVAVMMDAANNIGHLRETGDYELAMGTSPTLGTTGWMLLTQASAHSSILGLIRHTRTLLSNKAQLDRDRAGQGKNDLHLDTSTGKLPVEKFAQRLRAFVRISRAFNIIPVLMTQPSDSFRNELTPNWVSQSDQAQFNQVTRDVAAQEKAELIDLVGFLQEEESREGGFKKPVFYDGIHVTDFGSMLEAGYIAERLHAILSHR